jgi:hypothetical protein
MLVWAISRGVRLIGCIWIWIWCAWFQFSGFGAASEDARRAPPLWFYRLLTLDSYHLSFTLPLHLSICEWFRWAPKVPSENSYCRASDFVTSSELESRRFETWAEAQRLTGRGPHIPVSRRGGATDGCHGDRRSELPPTSAASLCGAATHRGFRGGALACSTSHPSRLRCISDRVTHAVAWRGWRPPPMARARCHGTRPQHHRAPGVPEVTRLRIWAAGPIQVVSAH